MEQFSQLVELDIPRERALSAVLAYHSRSKIEPDTDFLDVALAWLTANPVDVPLPALTLKAVVCARYDLAMSPGKLAAQVGHGIHSLCRESDEDLIEEWEHEDSSSKIVVLGVKDQDKLLQVVHRAESLGVGAFPIEDAGRTEVDPGTMTVAAIGPCYEGLIDLITGSLRPYKTPAVAPVAQSMVTDPSE